MAREKKEKLKAGEKIAKVTLDVSSLERELLAKDNKKWFIRFPDDEPDLVVGYAHNMLEATRIIHQINRDIFVLDKDGIEALELMTMYQARKKREQTFEQFLDGGEEYHEGRQGEMMSFLLPFDPRNWTMERLMLQEHSKASERLVIVYDYNRVDTILQASPYNDLFEWRKAVRGDNWKEARTQLFQSGGLTRLRKESQWKQVDNVKEVDQVLTKLLYESPKERSMLDVHPFSNH